MKADAGIMVGLSEWASAARQAEAAGFDGVISAEMAHDPFLPLVAAAGATSHVDLLTGIAVAFARNPMTVAVTASDLNRLSSGRLILGLGTQVRSHIVRRYSMPWSSPAARMREFILAVRAIWAAWNEQVPLRFEGDFYRHDLMTPIFDPGPSPVGDPPVFLAAVGPAMTRVAGEVADGLVLHGFTTPHYVRDVTLPNLAAGLATSGRDRSAVAVTIPAMATVLADERDRDMQLQQARTRLAFYGSTPAYRPVLEHHGWGELGDELHRLSKTGQWAAMGELVTDEVLHAFMIIAETPEQAGAEIAWRYGDIVDRVQFGFDPAVPERSSALLTALRQPTVAP